MEEDSSDDFVIIEKIGENTSVRSPNTPTSEAGSIDSGYEDFVELSFEDVKEANGVRSEHQRRCLYGIRLFQYSPESEGNIYITNEEL